jgi:hypothetical protein
MARALETRLANVLTKTDILDVAFVLPDVAIAAASSTCATRIRTRQAMYLRRAVWPTCWSSGQMAGADDAARGDRGDAGDLQAVTTLLSANVRKNPDRLLSPLLSQRVLGIGEEYGNGPI